jgi:hypothetical protein
MQALASGGFQVGIARLHYPNGVFINTENYEYDSFSINQRSNTKRKRGDYEAAFQFDGLFHRTDCKKRKFYQTD